MSSNSTVSASSNRTVLVADDDEGTRFLIRTSLEQDGWTVEEAADGVQACEAVERLRPAIVLLDVGMPNLDGFGACERLRSQPCTRDIPVMMITGRDDEGSTRRAYEAGATDFISKPCNFTVLQQRLRYLHRAEQDRRELRNERDFVSAVVERSAALVLVLDDSGRIVRFNESCERTSGFPLSEARDKRVWDLLSSPDERGRERTIFERLVSEQKTVSYEGVWSPKDGSRREISWLNSVLLNSDGDVEHIVCTGLDVTERNQAEERIRFLASYDPLTGLPNRRLVTERLEQAIDGADGRQLGVLILDLDRIRDVNTSCGHAAGDQLLKEVTGRLVKSLRLGDAIARHNPGLRTELGWLGGEKFSVMVTDVLDGTEIVTIVERLHEALRRPFRFRDQEFAVTPNVGAALYPADGTDSEVILRNAESAMHAARGTMRGRYRFYSEAMHTSVSERLTLEAELRQAVDRGEFVLHYQDQTLTSTGRISGAEALLRWNHPTRGLIGPASFVDLAEETGLIVPIGDWVLREACNQVMSWLDLGIRAVPVAVNLSSAQFQGGDLLTSIASILNETSVDPSYVGLEITESMVMRDIRAARELLLRLDELGMRVAIDDFGTGYSALSALKDLPIQRVKIDQAFIKGLDESPKAAALVRAMIAMAHGLELTVVAEGVASESQLATLREDGCDEVQGLLAGQSLPSDQFAELLRLHAGDEAEAATTVATRLAS